MEEFNDLKLRWEEALCHTTQKSPPGHDKEGEKEDHVVGHHHDHQSPRVSG